MTASEFLALPDTEKDTLVAEKVLVLKPVKTAWEVAEKLGAPEAFLLTGENDFNPTEYYCEFQRRGGFGHALSAPLAICIAALRSVGVINGDY